MYWLSFTFQKRLCLPLCLFPSETFSVRVDRQQNHDTDPLNQGYQGDPLSVSDTGHSIIRTRFEPNAPQCRSWCKAVVARQAENEILYSRIVENLRPNHRTRGKKPPFFKSILCNAYNRIVCERNRRGKNVRISGQAKFKNSSAFP